MIDIRLNLSEKGHGTFLLMEGAEQLGEMVIGIHENNLTVYHTEVAARAEGKGLAKELLNTMVDYARSHQLKVIPLCPYVFAQFKRHPEAYADVWKKERVQG